MYKGIQMRSRLEARFAGNLDNLHAEWSYEGEAYASGTKQYLPDFRVDEDWFIEVKPYTNSKENDPNKILDAMGVIAESRPDRDTYLALATPDLGSLLYCEYVPDPATPYQRQRGMAAFFPDFECCFLLPMFGPYEYDIPHWIAGGMGVIDWGWK